MINIFSMLKGLGDEQRESVPGSTAMLDRNVIDSFIANKENTFLISFPRTGSHWLRMIMELYFKRPSLVRIFYYPEITNYLTLHTHDIDLSVERENVIYLYRDPVDTVYSQLNYYKEDIHDISRIVYWSDLYGRHLDKWLHRETFTQKKTVLTYEGMKRDMVTEFSKITGHFGEEIDKNRLMKVTERITMEEVKKKTSHDSQVIQLKADYTEIRDGFTKRNSLLVWDAVLKGRPYIMESFSHMNLVERA